MRNLLQKRKKPLASEQTEDLEKTEDVRTATVTSLLSQFNMTLASEQSGDKCPNHGAGETSTESDMVQLPNTGLVETWSACHGALNLLGLDSAPSVPSSSPVFDSHAKLPVASASVMATLRGLVHPEFTDFVRRLSDHMEYGTCAHTCLKVMMNRNTGIQTELETINHGGFLTQLEEASEMTEVPQSSDSLPVSAPPIGDTCTGTVQNLPSTESSTYIAKTPRRTSPRKLIPSPRKLILSSPRETIQPTMPSTSSVDLNNKTPEHKYPRTLGLTTGPSPSVSDCADQVKLLPTSPLCVGRQALRKACHIANAKKDNAAYHLMYRLLSEVFTIEDLANSRGLGIGRARPGEEDRPVLDADKIGVLKEYVNSWCRKNMGMVFPDKSLNNAVTERSSYARKQIKKL